LKRKRIINKTALLLRMAILGKAVFLKDEIRPVETIEEAKFVQKLLYKEYRAKSLCEECSSQSYLNLFSLFPSATTLISRRKKKIMGTVMYVEDGFHKLPADILYSEELNEMRESGCRLLEVGSLALNSAHFNKKTHSLTSIRKLTTMRGVFP
jgi:hypothetical protein